MTVRSVVPALAALAVLSSAATAADKDVVAISGWSDNLFSISDNDFTQNTAGTAKNEGDTQIGFATNASLKLGWTVTPRVHARVNVWLMNTAGGAASASAYGNPTDNALSLRESFVVVDLSGDLSWTMGKYENNLGWISKEPTGLYRVNPSTIGYENALYGNDVVGTAVTYRPKGSRFNGTFHLVNGYFQGGDSLNNGSGHPTGSRENWDLGYGVDLGWDFGKMQGDKTSNLDLELAYDPHGGTNTTAAGQRGGSVFQVGLNGTARPGEWAWNKDLTLGAEVIWRETTTAKAQTGGGIAQVDGTHDQTLGWMLLGNYGIGAGSSMHWLKFPASLTGSIQQYTLHWRNGDDNVAVGGQDVRTEYAVALLTNPLDNANFGLNAEVAYDFDHDSSAFGGTHEAWQVTVEAIAVIP